MKQGAHAILPLAFGAALYGFALRLVAIDITGDENWALTMARRARDPATGAAFLLGSGVVMISTWTASTALGALVGAAMGDLERFGLGFAFTAAFIAMARGMFRRPRNIAPWAASFAATLGLVMASVPTALAIVLGTLTGVAAILLRTTVQARKSWAYSNGP